MVLVKESPHNLIFRFNSILWGYVSSFIGIALGTATYFAFAQEGNNWIVSCIFVLFSLIFFYSAIYSFNLHRSLEIDESKQVIRYVESSLYKNINWQKNFQHFKEIKTFRPITTAGSFGAKKTKNWSIQLISKEDEVFAIGYNQFGALSRQKAEELVTRIADMMGIPKICIDD